MKVLFQSRKSLFTGHLGGDTIQVLKTKEYLEKLGVSVTLSLDLEPDVSSYDIVHVFNFTRPQEAYLQARNAKVQGKKIVLSPILVDYSEYDNLGRGILGKFITKFLNKHQIEYCKLLARALIARQFDKGVQNILKKGFKAAQLETLRYVDFVLPNSLSEWHRFATEYLLAEVPYSVVPNAVDQHLFNSATVEKNNDFEQFKDCILCVASIDGRKNQLNLARAMQNIPAKLVLVGNISKHHRRGFQEIMDLKKIELFFLGNIAHEKLSALYATAKVHALPSYFETTGLSSLEAGLMGCTLVVSDRGDVKDYFKDYAFYCDPNSVDSIHNALKEAYKTPVNPALEEYIRRNFVWEITAQKTLAAYDACLAE